jgi:hypothetical protein
MRLLSALLEQPQKLSLASRYAAACGVFYLGSGLLFLAWPGAIQALFLDAEFLPHEAQLARLIGMMLAVIGWLSIFGGRTGGRQFVAASILDRIVLVPVVLVPLALSDIMPHTLLTFAVLDPVLAVVAWVLLSQDSS